MEKYSTVCFYFIILCDDVARNIDLEYIINVQSVYKVFALHLISRISRNVANMIKKSRGRNREEGAIALSKFSVVLYGKAGTIDRSRFK